MRREVLWHESDMNARIPGIDWTDGGANFIL